MLIPKLENTIAPSDDMHQGNNSNRKVNSKDVAQLCRFYDNVIRGTYCPHLPHLFGFGRDPQKILDKVVYLLRNSMNVDLDWNDIRTNTKGNNRNNAATPAIEYFDVVGRTISGLLASVIDDSSNHIRRKLFVDWIDFSEDMAILSMTKEQSIGEFKSSEVFPVALVLFEESSLVIRQYSLERKHREIGNDEKQTFGDDTDFENFSIDIRGWRQISILQEIAMRVLGFLTSKECALERLEIAPEQRGEEPSVLLGGDMDTFFPSGIVMDNDIVSSLLASLKPTMLISFHDNGLRDNDLGYIDYCDVSTIAVEILLRLCLDWHRLGTATVSIPLLPCTIDAAVLTARSVLRVLLGKQRVQRNDDIKSINRNNENRLALLLDRMVCHPPGYDANASNNAHSIVKTIHSTVWTVLLDCLKGIAARLRLRRQRKIQEYQEGQPYVVDGSNATNPPSASAFSIALDLAVLDTIHFIATTTPSLALDGSNYCTARGIFPHLFFLSSTTSLTTCHNKCDWNNDSSLMRAANQSLVLFIHASLTMDANSDYLLDSVCLDVLKCRGRLPKSASLGESNGAGSRENDPGNIEKEVDNVTKASSLNPGNSNTYDKQRNSLDDNGGNDMRDDRYDLKRKRESSMSQESAVQVSSKRPKSFSKEISGATVYPITWYGSLTAFLGLAFDAGENLQDSVEIAATQSGGGDKFAVALTIEQIRCLSGGFLLVLSLIRKTSLTDCSENEYKHLSGISRVIHELSIQLVSGCNLFIKRITAEEKGDVSLSYMMADAVLECGLLMHFSILESPNGWDESFTEYISKFLDCVSSFSGKLLELEPFRHCDFSSCRKLPGMPTYFWETLKKDAYEPRFCLRVTAQFHNDRQQFREWLFDRSITTLNSLPLFVRTALMSSLHPVERNLFSARSDTKSNSLFDYYSLDLFVSFFNRYAEGDLIESTELHSSKRVASLLHFLPLMMISLSNRRGENWSIIKVLRGNHNYREETNYEPQIRPLQILLRNGLSPLIRVLKSEDTMIFQGLGFTLGRIYSLITNETIGAPTKNPTSVLDLLAIRHLRLHPLEGKKDELRGMMVDVANKCVRNDENPVSRYFLWMCSANYCVNASPSEILQYSRNITTSSNGGKVGETILSRNELLPWLVSAPFSDPNALLRKFISRELSTLLISNEYSFLLSRFASSEDFKGYYAYSRTKRIDRSDDAMYTLIQISDPVINGLFEEIDGLLNEGCSFSERQLVLPVAREARSQMEPSDRYKYDNQLTMQQTAARTLAFLCYNAGLDHPIGKTLFEKGTLRLIRMWAAGPANTGETLYFPHLQSTPAGRALAFGRLICLSRSRNLGQCLSGGKSWTYFPSAPFSDVLILNDGTSRREQYELLERMISSFFIFSKDSLDQKRCARETSKIVTDTIPSTIAQLVNEKAGETIRLIIGFNIYLKERLDVHNNATHATVHVIGMPKPPPKNRKYRALSIGVRQLQTETRKVCLDQIEKILPLVLSHSDDEEAPPIKFFTKLTAPATLAEMVHSREQRILKGIVWELGRDPYRVGPALWVLRTAAKACGKNDLDDQLVPGVVPGTNAAKLWVTKNFMYLIVNVVQLDWQSRKAAHRVQALRSLYVLLDFLNSSDAPQYLPQILSTVNAAIILNRGTGVCDPNDSSLCLHAVKCLSKFVRLSAKENIESVIDNLTTIVVSLLPVLEVDAVDEGEIMCHEAQSEAASMLEFLSRAEFVRKFPKAFSRIPFLPTTPSLGKVHASLRDNGIVFDNLMILSTVTSESQAGTFSRRETLTSENTSSISSASSSNGDNFLALQNRISLVASLLYDENSSVRKVALRHLVDLLRANRNLFHILVENEGGSSVKNYLTLVYNRIQNIINKNNRGYSNNATGVSVSNIIEILMQRCAHETDQRVRLQLATCLGEIGAIGEHRLDDISLFRSQGNGSTSMYEWRLDQPPWQSRAAKYELQLVTKYLVVALKAAPSHDEQLKIAYTIQQLLQLLDASVREDNSTESANQQSNSKKREMSKWLLDRLVEADAYEAVEPFWSSEFSTKVRALNFFLLRFNLVKFLIPSSTNFTHPLIAG